ncbi:MAG: ribokinase [Natronospirillum sp.]|uniref:ribokinase n=1 Tax=Natronospirillum sp. TaxID=2812955 RepID=UPI0025F5C3E3|nr:ribokinase [Natronospirillum sp.]MCH8551895.1 ribokinase [Natronospirillum sp.]
MAMQAITVLGAFLADLVCRADRMPVWGETLRGNSFASGPGGKGSNQAIAAARQGATVHLVTRLGRDPFAAMARDLYQAEGIGTAFVSEDPELATGTASIIVDDARGENAILIVPGACDNLTELDIDAARGAIRESALFISQLELPMALCRHGIELARQNNVPVLLNPAPAVNLPADLYQDIDYITPNETEAGILIGRTLSTRDDVVDAARVLHERGVTNVLITLGEKGVYVSGSGFEGVIPAVKAGPVVETTGAGDAFNGGLAAALTEGQSLEGAARYGNAMAGISVTRPGAALSMPGRAEVDELLAL